MLRFRVVVVLLTSCGSAIGQYFEPHSTNCIETAPLGLWSPWVEFDETEFTGQWFVADGPLGGSCSSGGGFFPAGNAMVSGQPVDVRALGAGNRFITAILKKNDNSMRPIRVVWNVEITEPGDVDGDGTVGFVDFITLSREFGNEAGRQNGDLDYSGEVGFEDFMILSRNFGNIARAATATASSHQATSVPEPATHAIGLGMFLLVVASCRRRNGGIYPAATTAWRQFG